MTSENGAGQPSGGAPDFSDFTLEQLQAELDRRAESPGTGNPGSGQETPGRHSRRNGLRGWFEARSRRQPLHGSGTLRIGAHELILGGWQWTWLGVPVQRALTFALDRVRNVAQIGDTLHFEIARRGWLARRVAFTPDDPERVAGLAGLLPARTTPGFGRHGPALLEFENALRLRSPVAWVTTVLVLLNVAAFVALAVSAGTPAGPAFMPMLVTFANVPGLVLNGEWWRLVTAMFAHGGLLHLALNMWALWSVGRLSERMFGPARYAVIYLTAGVVGGMLSIAWDPERWSVGASGAIFGVFGAFLAILGRPDSGVPRAILKSHRLPTLLFVGFNLLAGAFQPDTDNSAHAGGLFAGLALGFAMAPSARPGGRWMGLLPRVLSACLLVAVTGSLLWASGSISRPMSLSDRFIAANRWYTEGETRNGIAWQRLAYQASAGVISEAQLAERFKADIAPFWEEASSRLIEQAFNHEGEEEDYYRALANYARNRHALAQAIVDAGSSGNETSREKINELVNEGPLLLARIERLALLSRASQLDDGLRRRLPGSLRMGGAPRRGAGDCIRSPYINVIQVAESDSRIDGPAMREAAACEAQRLFRTGEFGALEARLRDAAGNTGDLPDGSSSLAALSGGLSRYFTYGPDNGERLLSRLADWRRRIPDSWFVGTLEAEAFSSLAWRARGGGYAKEIPSQAWRVFAYWTEMAEASLEEHKGDLAHSPLWDETRLQVALDSSVDEETLARYFAEARHTNSFYPGVYAAYLRAKMPRWGGSHAKARAFIEFESEMVPENERDLRYARLFWIYADLEDEQANIFDDAHADWRRFQRGFAALLELHPGSDYLLNAYARFACEAGEQLPYRVVRAEMDGRISATAWNLKTTPKACDEKFSYVE